MRNSILEIVLNKLRNFVKYHILTFPIFALQRIYGFDKWHIYGSSKPKYTFIISQILNQLEKKTQSWKLAVGSEIFLNWRGLNIKSALI